MVPAEWGGKGIVSCDFVEKKESSVERKDVPVHALSFSRQSSSAGSARDISWAGIWSCRR